MDRISVTKLTLRDEHWRWNWGAELFRACYLNCSSVKV